MNLEDLKFTPDWLKEDAKPKSKQSFSDERPHKQRSDGRDDRRSPRRDNRASGGRRDQRRPSRGGSRDRRDQYAQRPEPRPQIQPADVTVDILPDRNALAALVKQIQTTHKAYPLVEVARMFLEQPDRYRIRVTSNTEGVLLHGCKEDGPIACSEELRDQQLFALHKDTHYRNEMVQGDPPSGNFANVARCRLSKELIGPTNHHSYQPTLRAHYEANFRNRMSFASYQNQVDILSDEESIEAWKEQARNKMTFQTIAEPVVTFVSEAEQRAHFASNHLPALVRIGKSFQIPATLLNKCDRSIVMVARSAVREEQRFPRRVMHHIRGAFLALHLYVFKQGAKQQFVSAIAPKPVEGEAPELQESIGAILKVVAQTKNCTRKHLADHFLTSENDKEPLAPLDPPADTESKAVAPPVATKAEPAPPIEEPKTEDPKTEDSKTTEESTTALDQSQQASPEQPPAEEPIARVIDPQKAKLAADLHWLIVEGHIIDYHNHILRIPVKTELPVHRRKKSSVKKENVKPPQQAASPAKGTPSVESVPPEAPQAPTAALSSSAPTSPDGSDPKENLASSAQTTPTSN